MIRRKEERHSPRISKSGLFALLLVMALFAVLVVPVTGADGDSDVNSKSIGSGVDFLEPYAIAVEADGTLVVTDCGLRAVVRVNPVNGNRTIVSDATTGSGTGFISPFGIALEADGSLVIADYALEAVMRVNPNNGNRTIVSDANAGS